ECCFPLASRGKWGSRSNEAHAVLGMTPVAPGTPACRRDSLVATLGTRRWLLNLGYREWIRSSGSGGGGQTPPAERLGPDISDHTQTWYSRAAFKALGNS